MRAKKSLGQHFLKSQKALRSIIEAGQIQQLDKILEIGPGTGNLTEKLLKTGAKIFAIEKDDSLFASLKEKFNKEISSEQLTLIHGDVLDFNPIDHSLTSKTYKMVANIPYNITGVILKKFLTTKHQPNKMILLVQKEVAQRIIANDKKESILSISVKTYGKPKYIETVKAGSFAPKPKVDSAIIAIENISKNFFLSPKTRIPEKYFFNIIRAGFKSKRKKLASNLSTIFSPEKIHKIFEKLSLDDNLRAEDLKIEDWQKLANLLI